MISIYLIILFLVDNIVCSTYFNKLYDFDKAHEDTKNFFEKMKLNYAEQSLDVLKNKDILLDIDKKISEHIKNVTRAISVRRKRESLEDSKNGVDLLNGFKNYRDLNFDDARDINFFSLEHGSEIIWFTAVLNTSEITLYRINNELRNIGSYPLGNGQHVIVSSYNYGALLIIQNHSGSILILRFTRVLDQYYLQPIQDFELNDMTHLTIWNGMNQLHLSIASRSDISIFTWFGNYFDLTQVIDVGTEKLTPFQSKGFMYFAATGSSTLIFKYFLKFNKFLVIQRLPSSQDVSSFYVKEGRFTEHFLSLSTNSSTIIYKEIRNRFVPFQQIYSGSTIVPITLKKSIVLLTLQEDTIIAYQYDGWRFVQLNVELSGISKFHRVKFDGKELLLINHKNNKWSLKQPIWIKKKSYLDLLEEIKMWSVNAKKKAQTTIENVPDLKRPVRILRGYIDNLHVHNINNHNAQKLVNVSKHYRELASKLQKQKSILTNKLHPKNLTLSSLQANKVSIKCKTKCNVGQLNLERNNSFLSKFQAPTHKEQVLSFEKLNLKEFKNWKCPRLSLPIKSIITDTINGISLNYLEQNALKVIGNQEITGNHTFASLNATDAAMPLGITTNLTSQELRIKDLKVKELNLTGGGILLPLNGPSATLTGSIKASKLKVQGLIELRAKPIGEWAKKLSPIVFISEPMSFDGNIILENANIEYLKSGDFVSNNVGSVKNVLSNAVPLNGNIPVSLKFSSNQVKWENISLHGPQKWITINSQSTNNITGTKHMPRNVEITKFSYHNLEFPLITTDLCATAIIAPEIRTTLLTAGTVSVKNLTSFQIFGNLGERYSTDNSKFLFKSILPGELYCYNVTAKNVQVSQLNNVNFTELENLVHSWMEPITLNTSIEATKLSINTLQLPIQFYLKLNKLKRNIIFQQNTEVDSINNINCTHFLINIIKLEDIISFQNITFNNGFSSNYTHVTYFPLPLMEIKRGHNFRKNRISGDVTVNNVKLPYSFDVAPNKAAINIFVEGSASFQFEPIIKSVNNIKLKELLTEVWLATNSTIFYGRNLHMKDVVMKGNVTLNNSMGTLNPETWRKLSKYVLSKTKQQEIGVDASFKNLEVPSIKGSNSSTITSTVSDFTDIFSNSWMKNKDQQVEAKWTFNTVKVVGKLDVKGKINNMDLRKDVMRHDFEENIVTGKKIITTLTAENLKGYNFDKWANNALTQTRNSVVIKGHKTFHTVNFNNIKVFGTIMGNTVENILSKSRNQTIHGQKTIWGNVNASGIAINGLINDVNTTDLINRQLKKNEPVIKIVSEIVLQNSLHIVGNLTINGTYGAAETRNLYKGYPSITLVTEKMKKSFDATKAINIALRNRAVYINKLEVANDIGDIDDNVMPIQTELCKITDFFPQCVNKRILNSTVGANLSDFILLKTMMVNEQEITVAVKHDTVSIYTYDYIGNNLIRLKELYISKIMDAFVQSALHSMWIALRLISQTLVLYYQPWNDMQEYVLPATDVFTMSRSPNGQLLLLLSDGVWILDGLASPRNIIGIPLNEKVEILLDRYNYYLKCTTENSTSLMKVRHVGN